MKAAPKVKRINWKARFEAMSPLYEDAKLELARLRKRPLPVELRQAIERAELAENENEKWRRASVEENNCIAQLEGRVSDLSQKLADTAKGAAALRTSLEEANSRSIGRWYLELLPKDEARKYLTLSGEIVIFALSGGSKAIQEFDCYLFNDAEAEPSLWQRFINWWKGE